MTLIRSAFGLFSAAVMLCACGGSTNNSGSSTGPNSIFPDGVLSGQLNIGLNGEALTIHITFSEKDFSVGGVYKGTVLQPAVDEEDEDGNLYTTEPIEQKISGSIRQTTQSIPGHVYLHFTADQGSSLGGLLLLELPAGSMHDAQGMRSGRVELTDDLYYEANGSRRFPLELKGKEVQILWD